MLERLECSVVQLSRVDTGTIRFDSEYYSKSNIKLEKIIAKKKGKTVGEHKGIVDCSAFYPSITGFYSDDRSLVPFLRVNEISNGLVVLTDKTVFLPQKVLDDNPTTISVAYPGDIIIAKGGNTLAKVGLVTDEYPMYATCRDVIILRTNILEGINRYYLWSFFLCNYSGICVTDEYQVYHTIEKEREDLQIAGCWVHARRKFDEALTVIPKAHRNKSDAFLVIKQIQAIYREEGKLNELSSKERLMQRQLVIKPLVDALFAYLKKMEPTVPTSGQLRKAYTYILNQEKYLRVFLEDGEVPIDNNASERAIRGFCIGKKNWQMIDTINGAHSSAIIYSIAETAKANNLKPYDYFVYLLEEIPKHMEHKKIEPFLRTCYHGLKNFQKGFENNSSQEPPITAVLNFSMYPLLSVYFVLM